MTASLPPQEAAQIERRQFKVHSCLGRGGFGEVYHATMFNAGGLRTEVALKILHSEVEANSQAVQRLRDEGRVLGALAHPNILRVYDLVLIEGRIGLVTEFIEGQDLSKSVRAEGMPLRALIEVVSRVAEALDAAWRAEAPDGRGTLKLVHRDVKPANIRIGRHGEVKLLDFGVARADNVERDAQTGTGALVGSYLYMAPERFLDGSGDSPADVFSLGCCLYEGLMGRRFYKEMSLREVYKTVLDEGRFRAHLQGQIDALPADVHPAITRITASMLAYDPKARPGARVLSQRLDDIAEELGGQNLRRWCKERVWPPQAHVDGVLAGRVVTETPLVEGRPAKPELEDDAVALTVLTQRTVPERPRTPRAKPSPPAPPTSTPIEDRPRRPVLYAVLAVVGAAALGFVLVSALIFAGYYVYSLGMLG